MRSHEAVPAAPHIEYDEVYRKLTVRGARECPAAAYELADEIEILDLSHNYLTTLPSDMARFTKLRVLFVSGNPLGEVPEALADCTALQLVGLKSCGITQMESDCLPPSIQGIILTDNQLEELPSTLGDEYPELLKLMLTGNRLRELPQSLRGHERLELLRVAANELEVSPDWLDELPSLAWYSDSANPLHRHDTRHELHTYGADDIAFGAFLGESAKNQVYQATLGDEQVAVKLFGAGITTDGLPEDEIRASVRAGAHPKLVGAHGVYQGGDQTGLVMSLVPPQYKTLAHPPDFVSYTRDVYPAEYAPNARRSLQTARDLADALQHLHAQGVMHGDVYAHNVLVDEAGRAVLADFGAASCYDVADEREAWREKCDVLGYGRLIAELAAPDDTRLLSLAASCQLQDAQQRPTFAEICEQLV